MPDEQQSESKTDNAEQNSLDSESVRSESGSSEETINTETKSSDGSSKPDAAVTEPEQESSLKPAADATGMNSERGSSSVLEPNSDAETDQQTVLEITSEKAELTEEQVKELLAQLNDKTPGPDAPTESYTHPVTGREVYVPKSKELGSAAAISTMALLMFVGGGLATLMMVARAFDLHGDVLVAFVIGSCAVILGMAGGLLLKTMGDKWWVGAVVGACFGVIGGILIYAQTSHHAWWH